MRVRSNPDVGKRLYDGRWHQDISPSTEYVVLSVTDGHYRLAGDSDDPCLYPHEMFELTDDTIPSDWVLDLREDSYGLGPREFLQPGFWEDVHDGKETDLATYRRLRDKRFAQAAGQSSSDQGRSVDETQTLSSRRQTARWPSCLTLGGTRNATLT